jgi:hypothetical protein
MNPLTKPLVLTMCLLAIALCIQSCSEQGVQLEKQTVRFSLSPASTDASTANLDVPENSRARISIANGNGVSILTDHEIAVVQRDGLYVTDPLELPSGAYVITDFMIINDSEDLYVTPKKIGELTATASNALPYNFSIEESKAATVNMRVLDVRNQDLGKFGYASSRARVNSLSIAVYNNTSLTSATAELWQNARLLSVFSLTAGVNTINFGGDDRVPYTLTVYTPNSANTRTFNLKQIKKEIGRNPLRITLVPALVLTLHSQDYASEYEFALSMAGSGAVNINWGDGGSSATTLPFEISHPYVTGNYTAIVTGDINQITDFFGFSYLTIIHSITGLTNLTALKVYNPSWGAVPIKVDLSNCTQLETIYIAKYGAPYEPCDLRTEFKLPSEHYITSFTMDAPSFDSTRDFISEEELEVMFNNIYSNAVNRGIENGQFLIYPVVAPALATQAKIDILETDYHWIVQLNDLYSVDAARSRGTADLEARREQWLRQRFSDSQKIIERAPAISDVNGISSK